MCVCECVCVRVCMCAGAEVASSCAAACAPFVWRRRRHCDASAIGRGSVAQRGGERCGGGTPVLPGGRRRCAGAAAAAASVAAGDVALPSVQCSAAATKLAAKKANMSCMH